MLFFRRCCCYGCCSPVCTLVVLAFACTAFLAVVLVGAEAEKAVVASTESTDALYSDERVCGIVAPAEGLGSEAVNVSADGALLSMSRGADKHSLQTFANLSEALRSGASEVLNCGSCGACSNAHDIAIYNATRDTLTDTATSCALWSFLGRPSVEECNKQRIGFSPACNKCWVNNVMCDQAHCKWTCLKMLLFEGRQGQRRGGYVGASEPSAGGEEEDRSKSGGLGPDGAGRLNDCLLCDERMCGPAFFRCARANRRTSGIISDIGRLAVQNCNKTGLIECAREGCFESAGSAVST